MTRFVLWPLQELLLCQGELIVREVAGAAQRGQARELIHKQKAAAARGRPRAQPPPPLLRGRRSRCGRQQQQGQHHGQLPVQVS
eukprot:SAG25_NODE_2058_length_1993_cov_3.409715_3_plen_84_part_00